MMVSSIFWGWHPKADSTAVPLAEKGPLDEYDARVAAGRLKNDEYQRGRQASYALNNFAKHI